jgi:hypothetical protein
MPSKKISPDLARAHRRRLRIEDENLTIDNSITDVKLTVQDEGVTVGTPEGIDIIDIVGDGAVATGLLNKATITITAGSGVGAFDWGKYIQGFRWFPRG